MKTLASPVAMTKNNTVTTFVGALAGGAIAMAALYTLMPSANPIQANSSKPAASHAATAATDDGLGSCTVKSASSDSAAAPAPIEWASSVAPVATHTVERVVHHTHTSSNTSTTTNNTTNTNSGAQATGGLVGAAVNTSALNNSLNGNEVNVPILSGNDVNVLNNSPILSDNNVLNNNEVLNDVLDGGVLIKAVGGLL